MRRELPPRLRADIRFLDREGLRWDLSYFFGRRTDAWYLGLFPRHSGTVSGEITPAYSILEETEVGHGRRIRDLSLEEMFTLARSDTVALRSDYHRTLRNWGRHYPSNRFFIRFLEDVRDDPQRLLHDLFGFLAVDPSKHSAADLLERRVHASSGDQEIPLELARFHLGMIREIESRFGGHAVAWRERAERLIAG